MKPQSIPASTLDGFHRNDSALAMRYATDTALIRRNGGEPGTAQFELTGERDVFSEPTRILLATECPLELRVSAVIRNKLDISRSEYKKLCESGRLRCVSGQNISKCKLSGTIILETK